ncbi:MAG: phosphoribosylaminoimidazolesuccinocarboxamide synthase [Dissulfurimicrobium sp.]|uniref:phosphoribosylaminoimidazolesuccinocarboxamide synthase n=1 Tax=Dissulfurimicrobium sp. TaxID=2022436 RepID=UPI00404ABCA8
MPVFETDFDGVKLLNRGKVRDVYEVEGNLLIVATDRLSAFDVVLPTPIPDKGKVLTQMSLFWFDFLKDVAPNHLITADINKYPEVLISYKEQLEGRSMLVKKASPLPVECIVRGYLSGSGWSDYRKTGAVCGIGLPQGLAESEALPEPIFTPSTKAAIGVHDENISFETMIDIIGKDLAQTVKNMALSLYSKAAAYARKKGVIIADTKFEFGMADGRLILIDEVLTPDSSRFWSADSYRPGGQQPSFDKQFVRDYLESIGWDKMPPGPSLPVEIVEKTRARYLEALKRLTGRGLV